MKNISTPKYPFCTQSAVAVCFVALALFSLSTAQAQTTLFGSAPGRDGFGGFTASVSTIIPTPAPAWSNEITGVRMTNDPTTDSGQVNSSLLDQFSLFRTSGSTATITGVANLTSTYAADNNRLGISLFGTSDDLAGIDTGLSLQVNLGTGDIRFRSPGVNGGTSVSLTALDGVTASELIGQTLTYTADISFVGTDIEIDFTLSAPVNSYSQTISGTFAAASYTGEYFGFGSRGRVRKTSPGVNDAPFIYEAQSFSVTTIPEPSTFALMALAGLAAMFFRRRR